MPSWMFTRGIEEALFAEEFDAALFGGLLGGGGTQLHQTNRTHMGDDSRATTALDLDQTRNERRRKLIARGFIEHRARQHLHFFLGIRRKTRLEEGLYFEPNAAAVPAAGLASVDGGRRLDHTQRNRDERHSEDGRQVALRDSSRAPFGSRSTLSPA